MHAQTSTNPEALLSQALLPGSQPGLVFAATVVQAAQPAQAGSQRPAAAAQAYELLDDPREWEAFSRPLDAQRKCWESHLVIEGMHCAACAITVEDALRALGGVRDVRVSAGSHRARLVWDADQLRPSQWMQAIDQTGYRALPAQDAFAQAHRQRQARQALWRLGVAGLCMMQVMMYAWPAYIAQPGDLSPELAQLLRWASWVLSLPVLLFACGPFFAAALRDVLHRRISMDLPVALGIAITFIASTAGTFDPQGPFGREVYFDSLTMFVFFLLCGRWLELRMRDRTAGALDALLNRLPQGVQRQRADGSFEQVAVRALRPGDQVRVLPGEVIPCDAVLTEGSTQVDEALLTGESTPLHRNIGEAVLAGSHNLTGVIGLRVTQVGTQTRYGEIVALMASAATSRPLLAQRVDQLARPFLWGVLLAAAGAAAYGWQQDPGHAVMVAVAVLVVTCPCALSLATPAALLAAAGQLARRGVLVRNLASLEALAEADTVVFDKTGTLTQDRLSLQGTEVRAGVSTDSALAMAAALATQSLHPASRALVRAAQDQNLPVGLAVDVQESAGQGVTGRVFHQDTGPQGQAIRLGSASYCGLPPGTATAPQVHLCDASGWLASFTLGEVLRDDALTTVQALAQAGLEVHILSGDSVPSVQRIAAQLGVLHAQGCCSPHDKLSQLRALQAQGRRVVMVGDGLNDGPVLAGAHVSFSVGEAVALARSQVDFVVQGVRLRGVAETLSLARKTQRVVRQNLAWALAYNLVCIPLAVLGYLPAWLAGLGMAASSLLVVLNALRLSDIGISRRAR